MGRLSKLNLDYELKLQALTGQSDRERDAFERQEVKLKLPSLEECEAAAPLLIAPAPPPPPDPLWPGRVCSEILVIYLYLLAPDLSHLSRQDKDK